MKNKISRQKIIILISLLIIVLGAGVYFLLVNLNQNKDEINESYLNSGIETKQTEFDASLFENEIFKSLVRPQKISTSTITELEVGRDNPFLAIDFGLEAEEE